MNITMEQSPELQNEANMELQFVKVPFEAGYKQKWLFGLDISPPHKNFFL